jgi:ketosteroid isomerase-like protein
MSIEANKTVVRRYFEDAPHHPDACDEIFAPKFLFHTIQQAALTPQTVASSPADERAVYEHLKAVWGGWDMTIDQMLAEGDRVMVQWTFRGIHQGEFHGLPPTGKPIAWSGINIFRLADGKIAEVWDLADRLWMWQQLGVLPDIREAPVRATEGAR